MSRSYIKQLTISGFQAFAGPVTIPLGPLTMIYGPNSAGKSAILDAMGALADLCDLQVPAKQSSEYDVRQINSMIARHWRRRSVVPPIPVETMLLGAAFRVEGGTWALAGFASEYIVGVGPVKPKAAEFEEAYSVLRPLMKSQYLDVDIQIEYEVSDTGQLQLADQTFARKKSVAINLNGSPLLRLFQSKDLAVLNLAHPGLRDWSSGSVLRQLYELNHLDFYDQDGWMGLYLSYLSDGWLVTNAVNDIEGSIPEEILTQLHDATKSFTGMFDALFRACLRSAHDVLRIPLVPASRSVPLRSEVTFLLAEDGTPLSGESVGLQINGLPQHMEIVRCAFAAELEKSDLHSSRNRIHAPGSRGSRQKKPPVDLVNRLLRDYLFRESGYFVAAGVHELIALESSSEEKVEYSNKKHRSRFLVSLELRDSVGRHFYFDEVGSGLGYVLPVLLAVAECKATFLQQPELHLHPALQSELADALIAVLGDSDFGGHESQGCQQIFVETHSEHLLLRLLRRVRQAADPNRSLDPHSFGRENLVILYVDPQPNGESMVKHLRVARDGEFIDRWPRGFFEERWTELFDE